MLATFAEGTKLYATFAGEETTYSPTNFRDFRVLNEVKISQPNKGPQIKKKAKQEE